MKRNVFKSSIIAGLIILMSCEYHHNSRIINESNEDIELIAVFNRQVYEDAWGKDSYMPFLRQYNNEPPKITLLNFDSTNLISHYRIKNNGFFSIDHGLDGKIIVPTYEDFISLTVMTKTDTLIIDTPQEFKNRFASDEKNNFAWVIK